MGAELCPWAHMSDDDLKKFLADPLNDENAPDRKIVIDYLREHFKGVKFLDVGSGTGNQYLALKQSGMEFDYCGVDKVERMVRFARRRFPEAQFTQGDIHRLPFGDRAWPVVYLRHILTHLPGYERALAEMARICGDCLIICLLKPLADKQQIHVEGKPPDQTKPGDFTQHYLNVYARGPFMAMLKDLGFNVVMDCWVKVGGYFEHYELIVARRP